MPLIISLISGLFTFFSQTKADIKQTPGSCSVSVLCCCWCSFLSPIGAIVSPSVHPTTPTSVFLSSTFLFFIHLLEFFPYFILFNFLSDNHQFDNLLTISHIVIHSVDLPGRLPFLFTPQQAQQRLLRQLFSNFLVLDQLRFNYFFPRTKHKPKPHRNPAKCRKQIKSGSPAAVLHRSSPLPHLPDRSGTSATNQRHGRTMAQAFSASLDSAFSLDSDVSHLSQTIDQK